MTLKVGIFVLMSILSCLAKAQTYYDGIFRAKSDGVLVNFPGTEYTFSIDGTFKLRLFTDFGDFYGIGKYELKNSELILEYEEAPTIIDTDSNTYEIINAFLLKGDTIIYTFHVKDYRDTAASSSFVHLMDSYRKTLEDEQGNIREFKADSNGNIIVKFRKSDKPRILAVALIIHKLLLFEVNDDDSKEINVKLKIDHAFFYPKKLPSGVIERRKLRKISDTEFYVKFGIYWRHYIKVE